MFKRVKTTICDPTFFVIMAPMAYVRVVTSAVIVGGLISFVVF